MKFYVDGDNGNVIVGWVAPDDPSETPSVRVTIPGRKSMVFPATELRLDIRDLGMHSTGLVGFVITEDRIPGLAGLDEVEIHDLSSGTLIYKRYKISKRVDKRLMLYDMSVFPIRQILSQLRSFFSASYECVETMAFDTLSTVLASQYLTSTLCVGRPSYLRYAPFFRDSRYVTAALLRDPYQEFAERLLFLHLLAKNGAQTALATYSEGWEPHLEFASTLPLLDERELRLAMKSMPAGLRNLLSNPYTRVFGCNIGEDPNYRAVGVALDSLARLEVVGTRDRYSDFARILNGIVGSPIMSRRAPELFGTVEELAARLSRISAVTQVIEHDLTLYSYVEEVVADVLVTDRPSAGLGVR